MKISRGLWLSLLFLLLSSALRSEEGIWLTAEEWTLMQNLWISSDQIYPSSMKTLDDFKQSQQVTENFLTDFDKIAESDSTLLKDLDENNSEKTTISDSLSVTSGSLETTTEQLGPSFWESTGGKIVLVISGLAVGIGVGMVIGAVM